MCNIDLGAGTACTYIKLYLILHQLQYSMLFSSKGRLSEADIGYHKKELCTDNKSIQVISFISSFSEAEMLGQSKKKRLWHSLLWFSFHLAVRQLICGWNLLTSVASVNLTQRLCHVSRLHLVAGWHYQSSSLSQQDRSLYSRQYVSDQKKTCLFDADRKRNWNLPNATPPPKKKKIF